MQEHAYRFLFLYPRDFAMRKNRESKFYCKFFRLLGQHVLRKRPDLWNGKYWILHDDNAPCHRSLFTRKFLAENIIVSLPHPIYSPNLAPTDFYLFWKCISKVAIPVIQSESQKVIDSLTVSGGILKVSVSLKLVYYCANRIFRRRWC